MAVTNGRVSTTDISLSEVATLVGTKTDVISVCTASSINMMSKWKPFVYADVDADETALLSKNCGITIPQLATSSGKPVGGGAWTYTKPSGGTASPYRLGDFRGYQHNLSVCWKWGANGNNVDEFYKPSTWSNATQFSVIFTNEKSLTGEKDGTLHLDEVVHNGNSYNSGTYSANSLYIWAAVICSRGVYLKRTSKTIKELFQSSVVEIIEFDVVNEFNGDMRYISNSDDVYCQLFIGNEASSQTLKTADYVYGKLSLNMLGNGYDRKLLETWVQPITGKITITASTPTFTKSTAYFTPSAYSYQLKNTSTSDDCVVGHNVKISIVGDGYFEGHQGETEVTILSTNETIPQNTTKTISVTLPRIVRTSTASGSYCAVEFTIADRSKSDAVTSPSSYSTQIYLS